MKPIDELLRNLRRPEVLEFALASERLPCVKVGASFQPVDGGAPTTDQVLQMLVGAGGSRYVESLHESPTRWSFPLNGVGTIAISAVLRGGVVQARFTLTKREPAGRTESATMMAASPSAANAEPGAPAIVQKPPPPVAARPIPRREPSERHPSDDDEPTMISEAATTALENAAAAKSAGKTGPAAGAPKSGVSAKDAPTEAKIPVATRATKTTGARAATIDRDEPTERIDRLDRLDHLEPGETARSSATTQATLPKVNAGAPPPASPGRLAAAPKFVPPPAPPLMGSKPQSPPPEISPQAIVSRGEGRDARDAKPEKPAFPRPPDEDNEITQAIELDIARGDKRAVVAATIPAALGGAPEHARIFPPTANAKASPGKSATGLRELLAFARSAAASDLHLVAGRPALVRVAGELAARPGADAVIAESAVEAIVRSMVPPRLLPLLESDGACDFAFDEEGVGRIRANVSRQRSGYKVSLRLIPAGVPTLASLGLPEAIGAATHHHQGLIVVTGPTGHGKTSTLAALVDLINRETTHHIITVEDPIEYVHPRKRAMLSQREVGTHTRSFANALKASLRQDPDVIVVGELRDTETVRMALSASETGHLVLGTMNTPSAAKTIDRLIDLFPPSDQAQVRATLAGGLRMVVSQRLLPSADGRGMVAAAEILPGSIALYTLIRDNKTFQIPSLQQRGRNAGMLRLDESLADLVRAGKTTVEYARAASESPDELEAQLRAPAPATAAASPAAAVGKGAPKPGPPVPAPAGVGGAGAAPPRGDSPANPAAVDKRAPQGSLFQRAGSLFNKKEG